MQLNIQPDGRMALATADLARGWRRLKNTYGFCEESRLDMAEGLILRVQASIHAWPNIFGSRLMEYPGNVFGLIDANWGRAELRDRDLCIAIELQTVRLERLPKSKLPGIYQQPVELDKLDRIGFWFSLLIVLAEGTQREYPDIREWNTQFFMGGRPGGSRRH
jgi:hypothetical protein